MINNLNNNRLRSCHRDIIFHVLNSRYGLWSHVLETQSNLTYSNTMNCRVYSVTGTPKLLNLCQEKKTLRQRTEAGRERTNENHFPKDPQTLTSETLSHRA